MYISLLQLFIPNKQIYYNLFTKPSYVSRKNLKSLTIHVQALNKLEVVHTLHELESLEHVTKVYSA